LGALFDAPCNFVSLQQIQAMDTDSFAALKERHSNLLALFLDDFRETAAVIKRLDLVISADTAVAHLAASLGKPTWILIPESARHSLSPARGSGQGPYAVNVGGNWRITFGWTDGNATDVDLKDYH
jgi:plasmid maintenance system killer protein